MSPEPTEALTRLSAEPVHQQLSALLRALASRLGPGGQLPTEMELMNEHRISRATVRRALDTLVDEGLLIRHRGKGTFVRHNRLVHGLDQLRPFVTIFTEAGQEPEGTLLIHEWISDSTKLPDPIAQTDQEALHVRRLYQADGIPATIADIFVPKELGLLITRADLEQHPVYQVIQNKLGLYPHHADVIVRSVAVTEDLDALDAELGSPLLVLQRTTYDPNDVMLECTMLYLRPDAIELQLRVEAADLQGASYDFPTPSPRLIRINGQQDPPKS
jgi:GntR family transcriptional regulator